MQKIKNIEFLRVIGCLAIVLLHLFNKARLFGLFPDIDLYRHFMSMTSSGQKAVDLFFIISGFFFVYKLDVTQSLWNFIKKKIMRLYPVFIFCLIASFLISLTGAFPFTLYDNILNLLGLNGTFLVLKVGNVGQFWYVSAMLWVLALYFYLLKNYKKQNVNLTIAIIVMFCYGFMIHAKHGAINSHEQTFHYIFNVGMMRALGGIGVGYFIGEWYKNNLESIKNLVLSIKAKIALTFLEFICIFFIINNLMLHKPSFKNHILFIIVFAVTIMAFLLQQGFISRLLNNDLWVNLSKYTYSIYMTHMLIFNTFKGSLWKYNPEWVYVHPILNVSIVLTLVLILGIFTYHCIEKPCAKYLKELLFDNPKKVVVQASRGGGNP